LHTFGLDGAVDGEATGKDILQQETTTTPHVAGPDFASSPEAAPMPHAGSLELGIPAEDVEHAGPLHTGATVQAHELADEEDIEVEEPLVPVTVEINPKYAGTTFCFPSSTMIETIRP